MRRIAHLPPRAILVDKPAGPTSHDVVATCRRALGGSRTGHTGTLDPFATGLLVVLAGRATRLAPYLAGLPKTYRAGIQLGARSASGDPEGPITPGAGSPAEAPLRAAVAGMVGRSAQVVPALSAVRVGGERLYAAARRGDPVERPTRMVVVHRADLVSYDPGTGHARVDIVCGAGTYVRQLASDLGEALGCGAYCSSLRRTRVGDLRVEDAIAPDAVAPGCGVDPVEVLAGMPVLTLDDDAAVAVAHGRPVQAAPDGTGDGPVALVAGGALLAVAEADGGLLRPRVVLAG